MNTIRSKYFTAALIPGLLLVFFFSCKNPCKIESYPTDGWVRKHYDYQGNLLYDTCTSHRIRVAYYNNGVICSDSLVTDYISRVKEFEGYLSSEFPDTLNKTCTWFSANGHLKKTGNYDRGRLKGEQIEFHNNSIPKTKYILIDGNLEGEHISYFPDGKRKEKKSYKNGRLNGECIQYFEEEKILKKENFLDNTLHGVWETYYEDGQLKEKKNYNKGKLNGQHIQYHPNGKLALKRSLSNDVLHGNYEEYFNDGQIKEKATYKNGKIDGEHRIYHSNGQLSERKLLSEGVLNGNFREYYSTGKPKTTGIYSSGKQTGTWKHYHEDGYVKQYQSMEVRIGARCRDGSRSSATGRGACSHHGGVDHWIYDTRMVLVNEGYE